MPSLGAVPKPELSHQAQAEFEIPEHCADVAIPGPDRGVAAGGTCAGRLSRRYRKRSLHCMRKRALWAACIENSWPVR